MTTPGPVILLSRFYAPLSQAGAIRTDRLVRALHAANHPVVVITRGDCPAIESPCPLLTVCRISDKGALPSAIAPMSLPRLQPDYRVEPDTLALWHAGVLQAAFFFIQQTHPIAILATAPPFGLLAIAMTLREQCGIKTLLDFRDGWITGMYWPFSSRRQRRRAELWEKLCLTGADGLLAATDELARLWTIAYGQKIAPTLTFRHGYEPSPESAPDSASDSSILKLAYVGQVRGTEISSHRRRQLQNAGRSLRRFIFGASFCESLYLEWMSPHYLMQAIAAAKKRDEAAGQHIHLEFIGPRDEAINAWARQLELDNQIVQQGPLTVNQANRAAALADVLVVNLYGIAGCRYHWCVPSKLYTYLGLQKPILGLLPPGEAQDILLHSGLGPALHPTDIDAIADQLLLWYRQQHAGGIRLQPKSDYIQLFSLENQRRHFLAFWQKFLNR